MNRESKDFEIWKDIPLSELTGKYQASNLGRVKSLDRFSFRKIVNKDVLVKGKILKTTLTRDGYAQLTISFKNGAKITYGLSSLIFSTFHQTSIPSGFQIDHIDNNKTNNAATNLQLLKCRFNSSKRSMNLKKTSTFTGVSWSTDRNKWQAHIRINGKSKYLGRYLDEVEAAIAYKTALKTI
jgi:hypothetical protein